MTNCLPRDSLIGLDKFHVLRVILVLNLLDKAAVVLNVVNGYAIIVSTEVLLEELLFLFVGPVIPTGHSWKSETESPLPTLFRPSVELGQTLSSTFGALLNL